MEVAGANGAALVQIIAVVGALLGIGFYIQRLRSNLDVVEQLLRETRIEMASEKQKVIEMAAKLLLLENEKKTIAEKATTAHTTAIQLSSEARRYIDEQVSACTQKGDKAFGDVGDTLKSVTVRVSTLEQQQARVEEKLSNIATNVAALRAETEEIRRNINAILLAVQYPTTVGSRIS